MSREIIQISILPLIGLELISVFVLRLFEGQSCSTAP